MFISTYCIISHFIPVLPKDLSKIQLYRCLGNSLNVHVVSILIKLLTYGDDISMIGKCTSMMK